MVRRRRGSNKKRSRDQNAPKKVKSAWQMFLSDNREEVKVIQNTFDSVFFLFLTVEFN